MGKFNKVKVEKYNEVNKMNYENRYNDNRMENKLNYINKALPRGYSYRRFDFIIENIGNMSVNTIKSLNTYLMKLYSECNAYYYNSDGFIDNLYDNLEQVQLENELAEIYGKELKILLNILFKFSEDEISLTKDQFNSACSLILYLTKPTYLMNIFEEWYSTSSKIYVLESVLDILNDLIKKYSTDNYSNFFSRLIDEIHGEYEEKINEEYGFLEEKNDSSKSTQKPSKLNDTFGYSDHTDDEVDSKVDESIDDNQNTEWGFDALDKFKDNDSDNGIKNVKSNQTIANKDKNDNKKSTSSNWNSFSSMNDQKTKSEIFIFEGEEIKRDNRPQKKYDIDEELFGDSEIDLNFSND